MKPFVDLYTLSEDDRVKAIVEVLHRLGPGKSVAFMVDDEPGKPERYLEKLNKLAKVVVLERAQGPVRDVVTLRIALES